MPDSLQKLPRISTFLLFSHSRRWRLTSNVANAECYHNILMFIVLTSLFNPSPRLATPPPPPPSQDAFGGVGTQLHGTLPTFTVLLHQNSKSDPRDEEALEQPEAKINMGGFGAPSWLNREELPSRVATAAAAGDHDQGQQVTD